MTYRLVVSGIYKIVDDRSGCIYVGSSVHVRRRLNEHRRALRGRHHSPKLQNFWNSHGESSFRFDVIELLEDHAMLEAREQHWIDALGAAVRETGFNVAPVAGSPRGVKRSDETRQRMSEAAMKRVRRPFSPEARANLAEANRRKPHYPHTAETRAKISALKKGVKLGPQSGERRAKTSAALKGKKRTPEMNADQSRRRSGVPLGPLTEETIARMRVAQRESWKRRKAARVELVNA